MDSNEIDFLRSLINYLDNKVNQSEETGNTVDDSTATVDPDAVVNPIDADQPDRFIPPLQAKIEMMKKMTGVEQKGKDPIPQPQDDQTIGSDPSALQPHRVTITAALNAFDDDDDMLGV